MKKHLHIIAWLFFLLNSQTIQAQDLNGLILQLSQEIPEAEKMRICQQIGGLYEERLAYQKAIQYYQKTEAIALKEKNTQAVIQALTHKGYCYQQLDEYTAAGEAYEKALGQLPQNTSFAVQNEIFTNAVTSYHWGNNLPKAIAIAQTQLRFCQEQKNNEATAQTLNNLGLLLQKNGNLEQSQEALEKSLALYDAMPQKKFKNEFSALTNAGTTAMALGDAEKAGQYFSQAFNNAKQANNATEQANSLNFLAAYHYLRQNNTLAIEKADEAIAIAENLKRDDILATSYHILFQIYQKEDAFKEANEAYEQYTGLIDKQQQQQQRIAEEIHQAQINAERFDNELKLLVSEQAKQNLAAKQAVLEAEQKEKDLALKAKEVDILQKQKALQEEQLKNESLEKARIAQMLAFTRQQAASEEQRRQIELLEKNKQLQELELQKQNALKEEQAKSLELLEKDKELQAKALEEEAERTKYNQIIIALGGILLLVALIAFAYMLSVARKLSKKNKTIKEQADELQAQQKDLQVANEGLRASEEELRQNAEELLAINEVVIAEQKKTDEAYKALKEAKSQMVQSEKMASLGQLTAGVAHEINNPVNFISGGAQGLKLIMGDLLNLLDLYDRLDQASNEEEKQAIQQQMQELEDEVGPKSELKEDAVAMLADIENGANRVTDIVQGLRNFSRSDSEQKTEDNLHDNINNTLLVLQSKYKNRVEIIKNFDSNIERIECFPGQLSQVFMNIIGNAVEAIEDKGAVTITTKDLGNKVSIDIEDTGSGIPQDIINNIFNPFFTTKDVGKGTGLGLSIVHGIIEAHQGTIKVQSEIDKGTCFKITLPK